ncbi:MAG: hypothetical protein M1363_05865 [Gammaproteobacteria bacterium]|nr:hypothetical protein [Gammaproteobacteria bacterium]MCL5255640.1 hypothetical protein [Gammaproteobacteria bacterium]
MKAFRFIALSLTVFGASVAMSTAAAQGRPAVNDNQNQSLATQLRACAAISESTERLQCFDNLAARVDGAEAAARREDALRQAQERAAEAEARARAAEAREAQRRAEAEERQRREPPSEKTYYDVIEVWQNPAGLQRMRLDNGQVWLQRSSADRVEIREGQRYFIEPGRIGNSFFMGADGSNRRMRVQQQR